MKPLPEPDGLADIETDFDVKVDFTACGRCSHPRYMHSARCATVFCGCSAWRKTKPTNRGRETTDYLGAARRFIRAAGRRVADADEPELAALLGLQADLDAAIADAVAGQKTRKSWAQIALGTGTTREAAYQRWGKVKP